MQPEHPPPVVCDAGPIIHLDELSCLDLLADFDRILIPAQVGDEVRRHRPTAHTRLPPHEVISSTTPPAPQVLQVTQGFGLHPGEQAAISIASRLDPVIMLSDDAAARLAASAIGIRVHGTIGIITRAIRRRQRTQQEVVALLEALPMQSSLHIRATLLAEILETIREHDA